MGSQRTLATFEANIADDAVFDEAGELSVPGGRNICERLVAVMRADAIPVTDPEQHKWYGWAFTASINGALTWLMLQDPDPWLLLIENRSGKSGWFRKAAEPSDATLSYVQDALDKLG